MSFDPKRTILTGGSGLLGTAIRRIVPDLAAPSSSEFNVTDPAQMEAFAGTGDYNLAVHCAAFTSPPKVNEDPLLGLEANIAGTANVVRLCLKHGMRLVYISTDYVYRGDAGPYAEDAPVSPVNKYAWSKLGGECAVQMMDDFLIIRTTFGPDEFPYPKAFCDQWTSRQGVSGTAAQIARAMASGLRGILHVGGPRRTVLEYAQSLDPSRKIGPLSVNDVNFDVPRDTSLDTTRFQRELGGE